MKQKILKTEKEKEAIIAEYLLGKHSYHKLEETHGVDFRVIHSWVTKFQGRPLSKRKPTIPKHQASKEKPLPTEVKQLQEELRKSKLYNELLNAMIDIAEDQLKIDIRKKSGTKR